jgi:hypothetical protein
VRLLVDAAWMLLAVIHQLLVDCLTDLERPVHPYPGTQTILRPAISHHYVIEPAVKFDSLARPQAPDFVFDLRECHMIEQCSPLKQNLDLWSAFRVRRSARPVVGCQLPFGLAMFRGQRQQAIAMGGLLTF